MPKLFDELALAHGDGSASRHLKTLGATQLLILDDWGLEPLGTQARHVRTDADPRSNPWRGLPKIYHTLAPEAGISVPAPEMETTLVFTLRIR